MKKSLFTILALTLIGICNISFAEERIHFPVPNGWVQGYFNRVNFINSVEYVPTGQSIKNWRQLITVQTLYKKSNAEPATYLNSIRTQSSKVCDHFESMPIKMESQRAISTASMIGFCSRYTATGKGEITIYRVLKGRKNFYILQKAWKTAPFNSKGTSPVPQNQLKSAIQLLSRAEIVY